MTAVHILNVAGFTGTQSKDDGEVSMSLNGADVVVTGTANGYESDKPNEPATASFKIIASC